MFGCSIHTILSMQLTQYIFLVIRKLVFFPPSVVTLCFFGVLKGWRKGRMTCSGIKEYWSFRIIRNYTWLRYCYTRGAFLVAEDGLQAQVCPCEKMWEVTGSKSEQALALEETSETEVCGEDFHPRGGSRNCCSTRYISSAWHHPGRRYFLFYQDLLNSSAYI